MNKLETLKGIGKRHKEQESAGQGEQATVGAVPKVLGMKLN